MFAKHGDAPAGRLYNKQRGILIFL